MPFAGGTQNAGDVVEHAAVMTPDKSAVLQFSCSDVTDGNWSIPLFPGLISFSVWMRDLRCIDH